MSFPSPVGVKTTWWKEKVSSSTEVDDAANHGTRIPKNPGPIPSGKTLQGVEKTSTRLETIPQSPVPEPPQKHYFKASHFVKTNIFKH